MPSPAPIDPTAQRPQDPTQLLDLRAVGKCLTYQLEAHRAQPHQVGQAQRRWRFAHVSLQTADQLAQRLQRIARDAFSGAHTDPRVLVLRADHSAQAVVANVLCACVELAAQAGADPEEAARCYVAAAERLRW